MHLHFVQKCFNTTAHTIVQIDILKSILIVRDIIINTAMQYFNDAGNFVIYINSTSTHYFYLWSAKIDMEDMKLCLG